GGPSTEADRDTERQRIVDGQLLAGHVEHAQEEGCVPNQRGVADEGAEAASERSPQQHRPAYELPQRRNEALLHGGVRFSLFPGDGGRVIHGAALGLTHDHEQHEGGNDAGYADADEGGAPAPVDVDLGAEGYSE